MGSHSSCNCDQCLLAQMSATSAAERQKGWDAWYQRDAAALLAFIRRRALLVGCAEHSEDVLHDTFLVGFRNVSAGVFNEQGTSLFAYLVGIAKNRLREIVRIQSREPGSLDEQTATKAWVPDVDRIYLEEVVTKVLEAYTLRPVVHRQVVKGIYAEGRSSTELATELEKTAVNVRAIAHRAVNDIKLSLECQYSLHLSTEAIRACLEVL